MDTVRPTRFAELGYRQDGPSLWRFYDVTDPSHESPVGAQYATKAELFGDLDRYAAFFGCAGASQASEPVASAADDQNAVDRFLDMVGDEPTSPATAPNFDEEHFSAASKALLIRYWQAEVTHAESQIRILTQLKHAEGIAGCKRALTYAREQLAPLMGGESA